MASCETMEAKKKKEKKNEIPLQWRDWDRR